MNPFVEGFVITATGDEGIHTGRPRFKVVCERCSEVVHANTTGPVSWADGHKCKPAALADHRDNCPRCHRPLQVTEPLFKGPTGALICRACADALSSAASAAPHAPYADLRTSQIMTIAARYLRAFGSVALGDALAARAAELNREGSAASGLDSIDGRAYREGLLRRIGEVQS